MFIDIHTHAFHPKIAYKAVDHLNNFYNVACAGDGTIDHLLAREKHAGVDKCVVLFGTDWPLYDPEEELERLQRMAGLDDARLEAVMSNAERLFAAQGPALA